MKFYYLQLTENTYLRSDCMQNTKNKYFALTTDKHSVERNKQLLGQGIIKEIELNVLNCKTGALEFNPDDTYKLTSEPAIIVHQTAKYQYTLTYNKHTDHYGNPQKHKKAYVNTQCLKSGKGVSL